VLALTLAFVTGVPELTTGPFGNTPLVAQATALTYVRVSSLKTRTRATNIYIPRRGISMPIRNGVIGATVSTRYAYHYPTTSWPGGHSNTYLYAHAQRGAFLNLKYARRGDLVILRLSTGRYVKYKVTGVYSVAWNAGKWVMPTSSERITLQTCLGNTRTSRRLIVIAVPAY
jgi:Sortase (surface protein transpeptidase)